MTQLKSLVFEYPVFSEVGLHWIEDHLDKMDDAGVTVGAFWTYFHLLDLVRTRCPFRWTVVAEKCGEAIGDQDLEQAVIEMLNELEVRNIVRVEKAGLTIQPMREWRIRGNPA